MCPTLLNYTSIGIAHLCQQSIVSADDTDIVSTFLFHALHSVANQGQSCRFSTQVCSADQLDVPVLDDYTTVGIEHFCQQSRVPADDATIFSTLHAAASQGQSCRFPTQVCSADLLDVPGSFNYTIGLAHFGQRLLT